MSSEVTKAEIQEAQTRFRLIFKQINEPNFVIDYYYIDNLLSVMNAKKYDKTTVFVLPDLIIEPIRNLEKYHTTVQVFLVRLLSFIAKHELLFTKIISKISDKLISAYKELCVPDMNSSLGVAYLDVSLSITEHNTGLFWILESGLWKEILSFHNKSKTIFIIRKKYEFATKFLWRLNDLEDEANVTAILGYILEPLNQINYNMVSIVTKEEKEQIVESLEPMLQLITAIVSDVSHIITASIIVNSLNHHYKVVTRFCFLLDRYRDNSMSAITSKLIFRLVLAKVFLVKPLSDNQQYGVEDFMELSLMYFNTLQIFMQQRNAMLVIDFCYSCNSIWNTVWHDKKPMMCQPDGKKVDLQNKMLFMCLVPMMSYIKVNFMMTATLEDHVQDYIMRLINASCEHTARAAYALKALLLELDMEPIVLSSIKRLTTLNKSINQEQANLIFQGLFYALKQFGSEDVCGERAKRPICFEEEEGKLLVFMHVLDAILLLVKNYDINWHESLEVICLYNVVYNILDKPNLTSKFIVTALNVITITVKKFLPPNLSLLMEAKPGSAMHELGKLIYTKMHDLHWEVRDSALELLHVCTEISFIKFPPFQKQILSHDLMNVAATVALNDHEVYVQASALKCLGAACKVTAIWDQLKTDRPDIQQQLITLLSNSQEGIVRKEACNVLCEIYQNLKLTPAFKLTLYEQMVAAAVSDFHWEVQLTALKFWKNVIQMLLNDQGMLDGTFPPVTFSRETRKIVTLNKAEIQKRLLKILDELASIGCLTVLAKLLHEDTEVEIMEASLSISLVLVDILKRYDVPECLKPSDGEPKNIQEFMNDRRIRVERIEEDVSVDHVDSENVIESILNSDDMNLLAHIYESQLKLQNERADVPAEPTVRLLKYVSPYLYVAHVTSKDFKAVIEERRQWRSGIRSISSVLDDILGIYEMPREVNDLDCY